MHRGLPVSAPRGTRGSAELGVGGRHHVHPRGTWLCLPVGDDGLVLAQGAELEDLKHDDHGFWVDALEEALGRFVAAEIFKTDQVSQFTSDRLTKVLKDAGIRISMGGKGLWMENAFIERL